MSTSRGQQGEMQAETFLRKQGYEILGRNIRLGRGELDIIARKKELLVFVEVKAHKSREASLLAVTEDKCQRLKSAASCWLLYHPHLAGLQCRFDLIILTPMSSRSRWRGHGPNIEHIKDIIR